MSAHTHENSACHECADIYKDTFTYKQMSKQELIRESPHLPQSIFTLMTT